MWFTDTAIAFVKEIVSSLDETKMENAKLEEKRTYYGRMLKQYGRMLKQFETYRNSVIENSADKFYKNVYVCIEPKQKPVLLDEAIKILNKKVEDLNEELTYGKKREESLVELLDKLTKDYYPGILDEIKD